MEDHPITEADIGVVAIRDTLKKLDGQVESIEKQIQRYVPLLILLLIKSSLSPFLLPTPPALSHLHAFYLYSLHDRNI